VRSSIGVGSTSAARASELYDLARDPEESHDVAADTSRSSTRWGRAAALAARAVTGVEAAPSAEWSSACAPGLRRQRAFPTLPRRRAPSPVTMVREWSRFQDALGNLHRGEVERATAPCRPRARAADAPVFQATHARALADAGARRRSRGLSRRPAEVAADTMLLHGLAVAARKAGLADEAMKAEQAVLAIDPTDAARTTHRPALRGAGLRGGRAAFERAVALDASAVSYWVNLGNARLTGATRPPPRQPTRGATPGCHVADAANVSRCSCEHGRARRRFRSSSACSPRLRTSTGVAALGMALQATATARGGRRVSPRAGGAAPLRRAAPRRGRAPRVDRRRRCARVRPSSLIAAAPCATSAARAARAKASRRTTFSPDASSCASMTSS